MSTLIFKRITLKNFLSYGNSESVIELQNQGTVNITGDNLDQGGSNGSGKSAVINALCYALYNKAFDSISLQRLVNTTNILKNTQMEVCLDFEKDNIEYSVFRARGSEYKIEILRNGEDITPGKGATECDALLVEIIGISYELFVKTIIFSGNSPAFLQLPLFSQRLQIEELFNITMLSEKASILKDQIRITELDIKVAEAVTVHLEGARDIHKKHIKLAKDRIETWDNNRISEIVEIEDTLLVVSKIDFDAEKILHSELARLKEEGSNLATKLGPLRKDRQQLTLDVQKYISEIEHLTEAKCPYCVQSFPDAAAKLQKVNLSLDEKGSKLLEVQSIVEELTITTLNTNTNLIEIEKAIQYQDLDELLDARDNVKELQSKIKELKISKNPHIDALQKLQDEIIIDTDFSVVNNLKRRLDHQQLLLKLLTDKNSFLRKRIINKSIPFLNNRLNYFTNALGLPHVVKFDADMSCTVTEFGRELDFGNLSAGEKKRVNTALTLAFRDVLHRVHCKFNVLIVDELDGALDQNGIDSIIRVLKEQSREHDTSVFVISHHPSIAGRLDRNLIVRKEQGFSSIVLE